MLKHIINTLALGGFVPFLTAFYVADNGYLQLGYTITYGAILALAITIND